MKKVLCFGDSNTWGFISGSDHERYDENVRYTKLLQKKLGSNFEVIEEGLPGRTCCTDDMKEYFGNKNGCNYFAQCIYSHSPLDYLTIMLGTNDLKFDFNKDAKDCAKALKNNYLVPLKQYFGGKIHKIPKIIIVAPSIIKDSYGKFQDADKKSLQFENEYKKLAKECDCLFVSNQGLECGIDKIHLTAESHKLLSEKLAKIIK